MAVALLSEGLLKDVREGQSLRKGGKPCLTHSTHTPGPWGIHPPLRERRSGPTRIGNPSGICFGFSASPGASVLLRQANYRHHLVLHLGAVGHRLAGGLLSDPRHGPRGGTEILPRPVGLQRGLGVLTFLGVFGAHRFYMGKWISGLIYFLTGGLFFMGWLYDLWTLNDQISRKNLEW